MSMEPKEPQPPISSSSPRTPEARWGRETIIPWSGEPLTEKELVVVARALGSNKLERLQGKFDQIPLLMREGYTAAGVDGNRDAIELHDTWNLPEKILSSAEKSRLRQYIDRLYTSGTVSRNWTLALEHYNFILDMIRQRLQAVLDGKTTVEIFPDETRQRFQAALSKKNIK